jgi:large subunit ribosomal protein L13
MKKSKERSEREWYLVDARSRVLGRLASRIATLLMGKNKVDFSYHSDIGSYVVVINSDKLKVTGKKKKDKVYYRHTGYPGGLKETTLGELLSKDSRKVIRFAVSGMLPKNKLRKQRLKRLKIYPGADHPYQDKKLVKVN